MYQGMVELTCKDILEKEFSIDTRGYRPQEVDSFLDQIIKDYKAKDDIISGLEDEKKNLVDENIALKEEIRILNMKLEDLLKEIQKPEFLAENTDDKGPASIYPWYSTTSNYNSRVNQYGSTCYITNNNFDNSVMLHKELLKGV